jgi:tRNA modification GTPase
VHRDFQKTIYAPATAPGRSAVALVRLSGPGCDAALSRLIKGKLPGPRRSNLRSIWHPVTGELLDRGLIIRFLAPASYTGEDMVELHVTGGRAVIAGIVDALASLGLRAADPGEFALRAFQSGKIDLSQVEGLAELVDSQTQAQRRQALGMADGILSRWSEAIRNDLVEAMSQIEAEIDFSDHHHHDEEAAAISRSRKIAGSAATSVRKALQQARSAEKLRQGLTVVIAGPPNAGKSTLINAMARREVAIVSSIPGTTRDSIEVHLELHGYPVTIVDTAGIRETADEIEGIGVALALRRAESAVLVLWLDDLADRRLSPERTNVPTLVLRTKSDLHAVPVREAEIAISAKTGEGLDQLLDVISRTAEEHFSGAETSIFALERHRGALQECLKCLDRVSSIEHGGLEAELVAEDLRLSARALGRITGRIDCEEILNSIFGRLCIGK